MRREHAVRAVVGIGYGRGGMVEKAGSRRDGASVTPVPRRLPSAARA
ncbi:hypothetical protein [Arenibaculum sp.]|jgi:hypothetical protein|nr:hypothetical protein [Arenibaculum sp.]